MSEKSDAIMTKKSDAILKRHEDLQNAEKNVEKDHTLQENAKERAHHPDHLNAGTAFDWEDMDDYRRELERLEREGPGIKKP